MEKETFVSQDFLKKVKSIHPSTKGSWGVMNVHDMVEHMSDSFRMASGKDLYTEILTPSENIPKLQAFILSDKLMRENTKNSLMGETPAPHRHEQIEDALKELESEIHDFIQVFSQDKERIIRNPFFGDLNYELWIALLYKHGKHHLRQFGIQEIDNS
jgi:hypothetical protein